MAAISTDAQASHRGNAAAVVINSPVLQDQTVSIGNQTRTAKAGVQLDSMDIVMASVTPVTFSGLDLMTASGTACATWDQPTFISGRSSTDFTVNSNGVATASAISPLVSSTGQGNLTGDYVWSYSCKDSNGHSSNVKQLTYHTVNPGGGSCGAITINTTDTQTLPAGFGTTTGCYILIATGSNQLVANQRWIANFGNGFTQTVFMQPADAGRYPAMDNINVSNTSNLTVRHFRNSGFLEQPGTLVQGYYRAVATSGTISNVIFDDDFFYGSEAMLPVGTNLSGLPFFSTGSCSSGCAMTNSGCDYCVVGFVPGSNTTVQDSWVRHVYNNLTFLGNATNVNFTHDWLLSPNVYNAEHIDNFQIADGATPNNVTVRRMIVSTADGDAAAQGLPFPGGNINITGYLTAGTGSSSCGTTLTKVSGNIQTSYAGAQIVGPSGPAFSDGIHILSGFGPYATDAPACTLIGSPGSPVSFYGAINSAWTIDGVLSSSALGNAFGINGFQGTNSVKHLAYTQQYPNPFYETSFTGSLASTGMLTIAGPITNNIPGVVTPWIGGPFTASGGRIKYPGCNYCGASGTGVNYQITGNRGNIVADLASTTLTVSALDPGMFLAVGDILSGSGIPAGTGSSSTYTFINSQSSGTPGGIGVYVVSKNNGTIASETMTAGAQNGPGVYFTGTPAPTVATVAMSTSGSYNAGGTFGSQGNCAISIMNQGTLTEDGIYIYGALNPCASLPTGQTVSNTYSASNTTGSDFASGVAPDVYLAAIPNATWKAWTPAQIEVAMCLAHKPSSTSTIVNPTITPATAVNGSGGGDWNDGLPSPHIAGCEAIP